MKALVAVLLLCVVLMQGCGGSINTMPQATGTGVELRGDNYKIVQAGAKGESTGFYLLGLLPLSHATYAEAKSNLYLYSGETLKGRSIALANQTYDHSVVYLILFSIPKITLTADIVEFSGKP